MVTITLVGMLGSVGVIPTYIVPNAIKSTFVPLINNALTKNSPLLDCPTHNSKDSIPLVTPLEIVKFEEPSYTTFMWAPENNTRDEIEAPLDDSNEKMEMNKNRNDMRGRYKVFFLAQRRHRQYANEWDDRTQTRRAAFATAGVDYMKLASLPFGEIPGKDYIQKPMKWKQLNYRSPHPSPFVAVDPKAIPNDHTAKKGTQ